MNHARYTWIKNKEVAQYFYMQAICHKGNVYIHTFTMDSSVSLVVYSIVCH